MDEIIKREDALFGHISKLCLKYGEGWSYSNLRQIRQFYLAYANLTDGVCQIQFDLSWSHYLICVLRIMMSATSMRLRRNNRIGVCVN